MYKAFRYIQHVLLFCGKYGAKPLAIRPGSVSDIDHCVKHLSAHDTDQLSLLIVFLKMPPSERPLRRHG